MGESREENITDISGARTLKEISDFWDAHSLADFWDQTQEAEFEVRAQRRRRVTLEPEVYSQIADRARARGITPETLINVWLVERLQQAG